MTVASLADLIDTPLHGITVTPERPVAGLLILHGISEHAGRYEATMRFLAAKGLACYAYDQRGHGRSPGERTDIDRIEHLRDDLSSIVRALAAARPDIPLFVWGHSMGAVVTALAAPQFGTMVQGITTTGCPLRAYSHAAPWLLPPARLLARLAPTARVRSIFSVSALTHDKNVQHAYEHDPLVVRSATLRLLTQIAAAFPTVRALAPQLRMPWLAAHGEEDVVAPADGSRTLIALLGAEDKQLLLIPAARHELHNEVEPARGRFLQFLVRWVLDHSARLE